LYFCYVREAHAPRVHLHHDSLVGLHAFGAKRK